MAISSHTQKTSRSGRTIKPKTLKDFVQEQQIKAKHHGGGGAGFFDRFTDGPVMASARTVHDKPKEEKSSASTHESKDEKKETTTAPNTPIRKKESTFLSPSAPLRKRWEKRPGYIPGDATSVTTLETTPSGGRKRVQTKTPRQREFIRSFKATLTIASLKDSEKPIVIELEFFQEAKTVYDNKGVKYADEEKLKKIRENIKRPTATNYYIRDAEVTAESIKHTTARKYDEKEAAKNIAAACGMPTRCDRSHVFQHSLGSIFAISELGDDERLTFTAPWTHNSMRLAGPEIPIVRHYIESLKVFVYNNKIELFSDEIGAIPIIKSETVSWSDKNGNSITFKFDAWNLVPPAKSQRELSADAYAVVFGSPKKEQDRAEFFDDDDEIVSSHPCTKKARR